MDLAALQALLNTTLGEAALQEASRLQPQEKDYLSHYQVLSRRFPPDIAHAALETAILRQEARVKFSQAKRMFFTRSALEQASSEVISFYRAKRFSGFSRLLDLGCSIGSDALALAQYAPVVGIDRQLLRLALAQANISALKPAHPVHFIQADLMDAIPLKGNKDKWGAFFDPGRRTASRRIHTVREYQPPLGLLRQWLTDIPSLGVKISPGVNLAELTEYDAEVEFISLEGRLKEAVLWFGQLKTVARRATLLPIGLTMIPGETTEERLSEPLRYLYEPDPAILRAGLVTDLAAQLNAYRMDEEIAYLTSETARETPFARHWQIEDWFPFQLKRLRSYLRRHRVGHVVVKKRGSPLEPEKLVQQLKLTGDQQRVIILTHLRGRPIVIVCFPAGINGI
jgi:SAM-dependent methyltransferase